MPRLLLGFIFVAAALLALGGYRMFQAQPAEVGRRAAAEQAQDQFAADRDPAPTDSGNFDAKRAMSYLEELCNIGPRISATEGMKKQQELLKKHFEKYGATVRFQEFEGKQISQPRPVPMANLIASWNPDSKRRVILCSHYDTRPIADQEEDERKWHQPFLSANDGGSGVALLMELAHQMKELKTNVGVDFVLFDGEEYIFEPRRDKFFFGSEYFAQAYTRKPPPYRYVGAVLLDMIAGKNVHIPAEPNSWFQAQPLVQELWKIAVELKCTAFENKFGREVLDDHIALNKAGIPAVDLIDFDYPYWHRLSDVPANCSGEGMAQVARVLTVWLQRVK